MFDFKKYYAQTLGSVIVDDNSIITIKNVKSEPIEIKGKDLKDYRNYVKDNFLINEKFDDLDLFLDNFLGYLKSVKC